MSNNRFHDRTGEEVLSKSFCIPLNSYKMWTFWKRCDFQDNHYVQDVNKCDWVVQLWRGRKVLHAISDL